MIFLLQFRCKFCYFSENSCFGCEFCDTPRKLRKRDRDRDRDDNIIAVKDRISDLPDVLLHSILSFLPTKDAVATSVLSRHWRWVYTWVTRLDFDDSPISHCWIHPHLIQRFTSFKMFVDNVLQAYQSEQTTTYRLHCANDCLHHCPPSRYPRYFPKMKPVDVNAWISFPLTRGVKELDIDIHVREPDKLPSTAIFGCQTLEVLKLNTNLDLQLPPSVCLPNLKELHITVVHFPADDSLTRLASSCPSLEHMALYGSLKSSIPINISNPSLRKLFINIYYDDRGYGARRKFVLDVPNLENFDYFDYNASCYSIGDLNSLVEARINFHLECMSDEVLESIWGLINPMSNVRSLVLEYGFIEALVDYKFQYKLPIFCNLNHLVLGCNPFRIDSWNKILLELLKCAPFLETLEFPEGIMFEIGEQHEGYGYLLVSKEEIESWSRSQVIPCCLRSHLKRIIIEKYLQTKWELEMVKYFLRNASVLEELMLVCETSEPFPLADKIQLGCTLQKLPRGSMTCSINVQ